ISVSPAALRPASSTRLGKRSANCFAMGSSVGTSGVPASVVIASFVPLPSAPDSAAFGHDLMLQSDKSVDQSLGARWAAGHVHIDRNDLVHALQHAVVLRVRPAIRGAG